MKFIENIDSVSPIIAESLLLAITVALAAIIAAYMMGLIGHSEATKLIAVSAERMHDNQIDITYRGGPDSDQLDHLRIIRPDVTSEPDWYNPEVGEKRSIFDDNWSGKVHIVVAAYFKGNDTQVILDSYV